MEERFLTVGEGGGLVLPPGAAARFGLNPGDRLLFEVEGDTLRVHRPVTRLARVYVEPTSRCNLECRTCIRRVWDEPTGNMDEETFERLLSGLKELSAAGGGIPPAVFFGGFGEPLAHPRIVSMIRSVKALGGRAELVTNGTLLTEERTRELIEAGLDLLWVSLDGATPAGYADVRLGDELGGIVANLRRLAMLKLRAGSRSPALGVVFVAMKRNIAELPEVADLAARLGAAELLVTNVYPYSGELREQILYRRTLWRWGRARPASGGLPRMDMEEATIGAVERFLARLDAADLAAAGPAPAADTCPFLERGSLSVRWDGQVSPCLPLLHAHSSWLGDTPRRTRSHGVGSLRERPLAELWMDPSYLAFRERLRVFDFSPCTVCNSCEMAEGNLEDCFGNGLPTCGGCLWAQGFIRCP